MRRLRALGHPLHPATVHAPLGLLLAVPAFDVLWPSASAPALALGLVAAIPAALTGLLDFAAIPLDAPHGRTAVAHGIAVGASLCLAGASLAARSAGSPSVGVALGVAAAAGLLGAGWLGGELVYRHGEGVRS